LTPPKEWWLAVILSEADTGGVQEVRETSTARSE